ncbi:MAG: response regulator [Elusimicrobia bacterium]|nr:response regulator [Elusimicrobiota bacterium]
MTISKSPFIKKITALFSFDGSFFGKEAGALLLTLAAALGIWFFVAASYRRDATTEISKSFITINSYKAAQIAAWRAGNIREAAEFSRNPILGGIVSDEISNPGSRREQLNAWFKAHLTQKQYASLAFLSPKGAVITATPSYAAGTEKHFIKGIANVSHTGTVLLTDLYLNPNGRPRMTLIIPISAEGRGGKTLCVLAVNIDPEIEFYPLLKAAPLFFKTAETMLIRKEGENALYLNELDYSKGSALKLKFPLSDTDLPIAKALKEGYSGFFEGVDYRSVKVFSAVSPVENSNWAVITKIDQDTMLAPVNAREYLALKLILMAAGLLYGVFYLILRYREQAGQKIILESERRLSSTLRSIGDGVISTDAAGLVTNLNRVAEHLTGWTTASAMGRPVEEVFRVVHAKTRVAADNPVERALRENVIVALAEHSMLISRNGAQYRIADSCAPIQDAAGVVIGAVLVFRDVTEEHLRREQLRASEERFQSIINASPDAIVTTDLESRILMVSPGTVTMFGREREEELLGHLFTDFIVPEDRERAAANVALTLQGKKPGPIDYRVLRADGSVFDMEANVEIIRDAEGQPAQTVSIARDITERKRVEEKLLETNRRLEESTKRANDMSAKAEKANAAKSEFLANMSHEIRTPMNSIIGWSEILLDSRLDEYQKRQLHTIQRSADALLYIINDVLDISKIEAGLLKTEKEPYDPREVAESVAEMFAQRSAVKGLELVLNVSPDMPAAVLGDGNRLRQILINLVGNAFKFTFTGQIKISAEFMNGGASGGLVFSVADTGVGISAENQKKLFNKFIQVEDSSTRRYGGTGLGLAISKALVEMMGGEMSLESAEGKGSVFSFRLPYEKAPAGPRRPDHVSFSGMRALLVDDNTDSLEILVQNMSLWGFSTVSARSVAEALEALKSAGKFDLLVVDHQMPGGNGDQFIAEAYGSGSSGKAKIMMLSSRVDTIPESVKPAVAVFLSKPIIRSVLFNAILKVFRPAIPQEDSAGAAAPQRDYSHLRILVVEDDVDTQNLARVMLGRAGYKLDVAANGREALKKCAAFNYDLVFMDIQMPEMDGHEAAFQLRKTEAYRTTPIIALTAYSRESDITKSLSFGMNAHITKPLKKNVLYEALERWLDTRRKVLVVDDNPDNLALMELYLKAETGLRLYRALDGKEALEMMGQNIFSLVLMDIEMPVMDGLTAVRELRKTAAGKTVPVVAFSAHDDPLKIKECLDAGYTDYLLKPVKKAGLLEKIQKYTNIYKLAAATDKENL